MHIDGNKIDDGIADVVSLLRNNGFETFSSCEGGGGKHAFEMPTVRMNFSNVATDPFVVADLLLSNGYSGFYVSIHFAYPSNKVSSGQNLSFMQVEFWISPIK